MNRECDVMKDLLPLYVDKICSEESASMVEEHVKNCANCNKLMEQMKATVKVPMNTDPSDVKKFKKYFNKKIWVRAGFAIAAFIIILVAANWMITMHFAEIWPKVQEDGIREELEIVEIDGALFLHQQPLFGFGEIVDVSTIEESQAGIIKFYLGEQGINSLSPTGRARHWHTTEKYAIIASADETVNKIVYCHKNGDEVAVLWEKGNNINTLEINK